MKTEFNQLAKKLITETFASISKTVQLLIDKSVYSEEMGEIIAFDDEIITLDGISGPVNKTRFNSANIQTDDVQVILPFIDVDQELFLQIDTLTIDGVEHTLIDSVVDASESVIVLLCRKL